MRYALPIITAIVLLITACKKEKSDESGNLPTGNPTDTVTVTNETGTWKLVTLHVTMNQTTAYSQAGIAVKAVTPIDYTTTNNTGTLTFTGTQMITADLSFGINTNTNTLLYYNGTLFDSLPYPVNTTVQAPDSSWAYTKIASDSLYFPSGGLISVGSGGLLPEIPAGAKLKFSGSTMIMASVYDTTTTDNSMGVPATITVHMVLEATLQKQ